MLPLILAVGVLFRLFNLGYSDFQGDEVVAQNYLWDERSFVTFLLTRTIGPGQFIISKIMNFFFLDSPRPEFYQRLPFALAGIALLIVAYTIIAKCFNKNAAIITTLLLATSGLLIAFARIVQYQTFVMLFSLLAIYTLHLYFQQRKEKFLNISAILSAVSLLFHYDSLSFILPIIFILAFTKSFRALFKYLIIVGAIAGSFYIPFILTPTFKTTFFFLLGERISSGTSHDSIFYSVKLLFIYHPKELLVLYGLGFLAVWIGFMKNASKLEKTSWLLTLALILLRFYLQASNPILIYSSTLILCLLILNFLMKMTKTIPSFKNLIELWFLVSFTSYAVFMNLPLTHIYNFFIPLFILVGIEFTSLKSTKKTLTAGVAALVLVVVVSALSFNFKAFIDTSPEYPWNSKSYIFGQMPRNVAGGEEVKGIFGFPYYRNWKEIKGFIDTKGLSTYNSNEKYRLVKYYMKPHEWIYGDVRYYIYIKLPQSLSKYEKPQEIPVLEGPTFAIYENLVYKKEMTD
ncbi:hypothetical protein A2886_00675 [candidate division WWE3 bacterium RIFCSPHIGHO2_01_FULL_42_13]|uniref:Glycosyltransferase RgtA/B/C/D-like domain-containing protein n=1 Tax=candidate division WWE3 bacterium RIFCSPHIGHO2_01_FULL_42_13 TaxID=1802617 RepID=A0A1F4UQ98_UNCKA|nr:MAG: hypothetical protein A2886_00675 [candidate division WWE3 bacterium RIFCSPHIGHO2_01_FULL_42_13]